MRNSIAASFFILFVAACSPEVGSDKWCTSMKEKSKADWSAREAKEFAEHCIFK